MEALREIPPVHEILRSEILDSCRSMLGQPVAERLLNDILGSLRRELSGAAAVVPRAELTRRVASELARRLEAAGEGSLRRVINATGVVLHTNLGRAPLPASAIERLRETAASYSNLEFDLQTGQRGKRDVHAERLLRNLLGCEAAIVVNNNAAAVLLVLNALGEGGEVIASRGEQVEIGGAFRIPEVMARSGAQLREVGTTNRTRIDDYDRAIGDRTRLLLRVHPSNFRMTGFTERPSLEDFATLGKRRNIPTFEDLGSGCMVDLSGIGITDEPLVADSLAAGVDVVSFSGDKLLGGPQAGIIAGKELYIQKIRRNPLFRALRVDKLTLTVLESILASYLKGQIDDIPALRMLRTPAGELQRRTEAFARDLGSIATVTALESPVGGGSAPELYLPGWGVELELRGLSESVLERRLRESNPPVIARVEGGKVIIDLRTVSAAEEVELAGIIRGLV